MGNNAGEATRVWSGRSGTSRRSTCIRRQQSTAVCRAKAIPPVPTRPAPTSLTCRPAGPCNLHIFSRRLVMEGNSGGYSCSGSWPLLYPGRPASPRKGKTELRPDLPMLTNINYHGCGVRGREEKGNFVCASALAHHRAGRCNLKRKDKTDRHTSTHINKAVDGNGGQAMGRHRGHFLVPGSSQIARCCQCRVEDPGHSPGATGSPIHVLRGRLQDRHVPYTESTHRNRKEQNK